MAAVGRCDRGSRPDWGDTAMTTRSLSVTTYVLVLVLLVILTLLTVFISFIELAPGWHLASGLTIGAVKALLVVLFFMHALHSPRVTWCVIVAALVWVTILFSLTYADYTTRSLIPYVPGH
jgi:cytochrome c oxidase subunit IV